MSLLAEVLQVLEHEGVAHALIGATALAVRGVSRSTSDVDLLTVDAGILRQEAWAGVVERGADLLILKGDIDDPLAGTVRLRARHEIVDVVVGRYGWQRQVVQEAESLSLGELSLPVARPAGLVLLKLHAGGPKDAWDIRALLEATEDAAAIEAEVENKLPELPSEAQRLWSRLRREG